ncbi:MAG: hypothetical protein ACRDJH_04730 [Thermomicrobiales bacterium]
MVTKRQPQSEPTYEEQVAIARANLDRHSAEVKAESARALAQGIDPEAELDAWVQRNFSAKALQETYEEYVANSSGWLWDESRSGQDDVDTFDGVDGR